MDFNFLKLINNLCFTFTSTKQDVNYVCQHPQTFRKFKKMSLSKILFPKNDALLNYFNGEELLLFTIFDLKLAGEYDKAKKLEHLLNKISGKCDFELILYFLVKMKNTIPQIIKQSKLWNFEYQPNDNIFEKQNLFDDVSNFESDLIKIEKCKFFYGNPLYLECNKICFNEIDHQSIFKKTLLDENLDSQMHSIDEGFEEIDAVSTYSSISNHFDNWEYINDVSYKRQLNWEKRNKKASSTKFKTYISECDKKFFKNLSGLHSQIHEIFNGNIYKNIYFRHELTINEVIRSYFFAFIGLPSQLFPIDQKSGNLKVSKLYAIVGLSEESLFKLSALILSYSDAYSQLLQFCQIPCKALINSKIKNRVRMYLNEYLKIQIQFYQQKYESLLKYLHKLDKFLIELKLIHQVVFSLPEDGVDCISMLYISYMNLPDDNSLKKIYLSFFYVACKPYLRVLFGWIFTGELYNMSTELKINSNIDYIFLQDKKYWNGAYNFETNKNVLPSFLIHLKEEILTIGKSLNFLKRCVPKHYIFDQSLKNSQWNLCNTLRDPNINLEKDQSIFIYELQNYETIVELLSTMDSIKRYQTNEKNEKLKIDLLSNAHDIAAQSFNVIESQKKEFNSLKKHDFYQSLTEQINNNPTFMQKSKNDYIQYHFKSDLIKTSKNIEKDKETINSDLLKNSIDNSTINDNNNSNYIINKSVLSFDNEIKNSASLTHSNFVNTFQENIDKNTNNKIEYGDNFFHGDDKNEKCGGILPDAFIHNNFQIKDNYSNNKEALYVEKKKSLSPNIEINKMNASGYHLNMGINVNTLTELNKYDYNIDIPRRKKVEGQSSVALSKITRDDIKAKSLDILREINLKTSFKNHASFSTVQNLMYNALERNKDTQINLQNENNDDQSISENYFEEVNSKIDECDILNNNYETDNMSFQLFFSSIFTSEKLIEIFNKKNNEIVTSRNFENKITPDIYIKYENADLINDESCLNKNLIYDKNCNDSFFIDLIQEMILNPILLQQRLVNKALLDYYMSDLQMETYFDFLLKYFLLEDGEFAQSLCHLLFEKLSFSNKFVLNPLVLNKILDSATASSFSYNQQLIQNLSFTLSDPVSGSLNSIGDLKQIKLTCEIPWPCNIVISKSCVVMYSEVFEFLLTLRRILYCLKVAVNQLKHLEKQHNSKEDRLKLRKLYLYCNEMSMFIRSLQEYATNQIINLASNEFRKEIKTNVFSLDDLIACHLTFIKKCRMRCLLNRNTSYIKKILDSIFNLILQFEYNIQHQSWHLDHEDFKLFNDLQKIYREFNKAATFLYKVLSKLDSKHYEVHLEELLLRLNFNNFYGQHDFYVNNDTYI